MPTASHDDAARVYYTFRAELVERLEEVPRWMLLRYLSTAEPTGHNREEGEALRSRVADAMIPRQRYVRQGNAEMTRVGLRDWAQGCDLYDWSRRLDPYREEKEAEQRREEQREAAQQETLSALERAVLGKVFDLAPPGDLAKSRADVEAGFTEKEAGAIGRLLQLGHLKTFPASGGAEQIKVTRQGGKLLAAAGDGAAEATPELATGGGMT